jgi:hypothetical protein
VLLEEQLSIEEETQVAPNGLRAKGGSTGERGIAEIDGKGSKAPPPGKMENFRLVVFKDKSQGSKSPDNPSVRFGQGREVVLQPFILCHDGPIIDVRHNIHPQGLRGAEEEFYDRRQV